LLADRVSKRLLMVLAEGLRAAAFFGLLLALLTDQVSLPLLALLGFMGAAGTVGFSVSLPAMVPALVPRDQLVAANGRLELARSMAFAAGPALAGALVSWAGGSPAFVLATILSLAALLLIWGLPKVHTEPTHQQRNIFKELREAALEVWQSKLQRPIFITAIIWNISWFVMQSVYVPFAVNSLGLTAQQVGFTLGTYGVGMVLGALAAPRVLRSMKFGRAIVVGPIFSVIASATMLLAVIWPNGVFPTLAFFFFGVGPIIWTITSTALRQAITPQNMLGRMTALYLTVNMGARPLGAAIGGSIGSIWGEPVSLLLALAGFTLQALIIFGSAAHRLIHLPQQNQ